MSRISFCLDTNRGILEAFNLRGGYLGYIEFNKNWNCNVWNQLNYVIMSPDCMDEVTDKMRKWRR